MASRLSAHVASLIVLVLDQSQSRGHLRVAAAFCVLFAIAGCSHEPPAAVYKPSGAHVFVSPDGLGDVAPSCTGKVPALDPAANIAQSLGVGLARAGFRSVLALEDNALLIEPTIHVRACQVSASGTRAAGDLSLVVSKSGRAVDRIVYDSPMQTADAWVKNVVARVLASKPIAAELGDASR